MPLHNYAAQCRNLADELVDSLSDTQIQALRGLLFSLGARNWLDWRAAHAERVASFVSATPSARRKQPLPANDLLLLTLAAYQHCCEAADLLVAACQLQPGGSYRHMAAQAGLSWRMLEQADWPDWPWTEPDPFDDSGFWTASEGL